MTAIRASRSAPAFADGHAFASLLGEAAPIPAQDFDLGLFLIAPHVLYRDHAHAAPELYAPLTGPHGWRFGPGRPLVLKPAHQPVWNPPQRPHLTKVGALPFLCLFAWTREVNSPARVIPADDWPALEALTSWLTLAAAQCPHPDNEPGPARGAGAADPRWPDCGSRRGGGAARPCPRRRPDRRRRAGGACRGFRMRISTCCPAAPIWPPPRSCSI
ncbi:MAG: dimethylsulfonioproprionate lyase family protein [Gemmobacter sp.]|nr:dimethylsulfonioproprionate lyase family protein [Gemmobacter sp.]